MMMLVQIPGLAFGALKEGTLPTDNPALWQKVTTYSVSLARGRGITVHLDLSDADWEIVCQQLHKQYNELRNEEYAHRGLEGTIVMTAIHTALSRVDQALQSSLR